MNEIESTLIIANDISYLNTDTIEKIIALEKVGHYPISQGPFLSIADSYFDGLSASLQKSGFSLRIRQSNLDTLITLKGPSQYLDDEITRKIEIEKPWSPESLCEITDELEKEGLQFKAAPSNVSSLDPHTTLKMIGFRLIQTRLNDRRTKTILSQDRSSVVAEMAIDHVTYNIDTYPVKHNEIEIELKGSGNVSDLKNITGELKSLYPETLCPWRFGKLSTGMAIDYLHEENKLEDFLFEDRSIMKSGYNALHEILSLVHEDTI